MASQPVVQAVWRGEEVVASNVDQWRTGCVASLHSLDDRLYALGFSAPVHAAVVQAVWSTSSQVLSMSDFGEKPPPPPSRGGGGQQQEKRHIVLLFARNRAPKSNREPPL